MVEVNGVLVGTIIKMLETIITNRVRISNNKIKLISHHTRTSLMVAITDQAQATPKDTLVLNLSNLTSNISRTLEE